MMQIETKHNRIIAGAGEYLAVCAKNGTHKKKAVTEFFITIGFKNCVKCNQIKKLSDFCGNKNSWTGFSSQCKNCACALTKKRYKEYKNHISDYRKLYYLKNKNKIIKHQIENAKKRIKSDAIFKLKQNTRNRIRASITSNGYTKKSRTHEILGCDFEFFKQHIERQFLPGMTWEKLGSEIHIDHIIPLASATTEEEVIALNHFTNLRPCWAVENLRKSDSIEFLI